MKISTTNSKKIIEYLAFCIGIILIGVLIQVIRLIKNDSALFPNVIDVLNCFSKLLGDSHTYLYIGNTLSQLLISIIISSFFGIALGALAGFNRIAEKVLKPFMILLRSLPMIILIVIIWIILNKDIVPVLGTTLVIVPIIYEATLQGIRNIEREYIDAYKIYSKTNPYILFKIHLPMISGYLKQAYSNAIGMGIKVVVTIGYVVGVKNSFGQEIVDSRILLDFDKIYAYGLLLIIMVSIFEFIPKLINLVYNKIKYKKEEVI